MEKKLPAAAMTKPSRFGTRNLEIASRHWQRRLAISRLRVPNLDGCVATAAGNLLSIWAPRHRVDPVIVRSQDTNQQKLRGKHFGKINLKKKRTGLSAR